MEMEPWTLEHEQAAFLALESQLKATTTDMDQRTDLPPPDASPRVPNLKTVDVLAPSGHSRHSVSSSRESTEVYTSSGEVLDMDEEFELNTTARRLFEQVFDDDELESSFYSNGQEVADSFHAVDAPLLFQDPFDSFDEVSSWVVGWLRVV